MNAEELKRLRSAIEKAYKLEDKKEAALANVLRMLRFEGFPEDDSQSVMFLSGDGLMLNAGNIFNGLRVISDKQFVKIMEKRGYIIPEDFDESI